MIGFLPRCAKRWILVSLLLSPLLVAGCTRSTKLSPEMQTPAGWRAAMQPPVDEPFAAELAAGPSLRSAIILAIDRNPGVKARRQQWLAAIRREPQAVTPPDPTLQFGYQFQSVETRVGPQEWNLGLTQKLPWWRKLWSLGRISATETDIARLRYEAEVRDVIIDVKDSFYELYYLDQALPITESVEKMLRNDALLAYQEISTGRAQLSEAFRAESQSAQLAYDRILLIEQRAAQVERFKSLLNLPPDTQVGPIRVAPLYAICDDVEPLYGRAEQYSEMLRIQGLEIQKARYRTFLAKLSRVPDVGLGLNFINTGAAQSSSMGAKPQDSGKSPVIGGFSTNLPIWEWRNRALIREKKALEEAVQFQALAEANQIRSGVAKAYFGVRLTQRLVELYKQTLLPQAEAVMSQAEIYYRNEQASFSSLIETTLAYHNFQLAFHRAIADHGQAIGRLERLLGNTAEPRTAGKGGA